MKKEIAFFDFDGTITTKDTLLEFIKYSKGTFAMYWGFLLNSPFLVAYKLKIITNQRAKEKVLKYFFGGMNIIEFNNYCEKFSTNIIPSLLRPKAIEAIQKFKASDTSVVIVSASPENWIKPWADGLGLQLLATQLVINEQKITGDIVGLNCYGPEKVCRIKNHYDLNDYNTIYAYGDSGGDTDMLNISSQPHFKPFRD